MLDGETERQVRQIAQCLEDHKGQEIVCIDVTEASSWVSCFIIATASSMGHMRGLVKALRGELQSLDLQIHHKHKKITEGGWELVDCGDIVIHIMSEEARVFYELERLWYTGRVIETA